MNGAIPLTETRPRQQWVDEWSSQLYIKVTTEELAGWGEVLPAGGNSREPYASLVRRITGAILGKDEEEVEELWTAMRKLTFSGGYGITTGAISGIDMALWDIRARKSGKSLAGLLGSEPQKVRRYASLSRYARTEEAVQVMESLLDAGYCSIKLHQSGRDTLEAVRLARKEYGRDFELLVDLNCAFEFPKAQEFMKSIDRYELKWVEEPVWPPDDFESLKKLNRLGPVAAGESFFSYFEFKRLMEMDALSYYQPDIAKAGGITPGLEILALARKHKARVAFHNRPDNGWVSTVASAHLAAARGDKILLETPPNEIPLEYFRFSGSMDKESILPGGRGLGIEPLNTIPQSTQSKILSFHES